MKKEIPWNLIISKLKQNITVDENQQLMEWLSDSQNQLIFDEIHRTWEEVQSEASAYTPDTEYYWKQLSARMQLATKKKKKIYHLRPMQKYAAVASIVAIVVFSTAFYLGHTYTLNSQEVVSQTYSTSTGKSKITLPDGTTVWLRSNSTLSYQTNFQTDNRRVIIVGSAFFDVAHNKEVPFIVETSGIEVIVHGTRFNVESYSDSANISVSLLEGSVALKTPKENLLIVPGETAVFNKENQFLKIAQEDMSLIEAWASDEIVFNNKPLSYICQVLAKRYDVVINLDPQISSEEFSYTFTLRDEPLNEILVIMSCIHPIDYQFDEEKVLTITKRKY